MGDRHSAGEIRALCMKATRGAGLPWGVAEDAGYATMRLERAGFPAARLLAARLGLLAQGEAPVAPDPELAGWCAHGKFLCPLLTGAFLADCGPVGKAMKIGPVLFPALLAGFTDVDAGKALRLSWEGGELVFGEGILSGLGANLLAGDPRLVLLEPVHLPGPIAALSLVGSQEGTPDLAWAGLEALAMRACVPESEASRSRGAGEQA